MPRTTRRPLPFHASVGRRWPSVPSHAVLDYVIPYVKERGSVRRAHCPSPVGGVHVRQHRNRARRPAADHLAWRVPRRPGLPFAREAALAKRLGTDKGMQIGLDGVQLLGGHGYTKEHPVERWYRDLRAIGVAEGVVVL